MKSNLRPISFFLLAAVAAVANGIGKNITETEIVVVTITAATYAICATVTTDVSNSVTNCRRRRHYWIDVPAYIAMDNDVDNRLVQFFNPTITYQVEPTVRPFKSIDSQIDYHHSPGSVQPTMSPDAEEKMLSLNFGFSAILSLIKSALLGSNAIVATKFEVTRTLTKTVMVTSSTKTIYISGCRPVPFPFSTCH